VVADVPSTHGPDNVGSLLLHTHSQLITFAFFRIFRPNGTVSIRWFFFPLDTVVQRSHIVQQSLPRVPVNLGIGCLVPQMEETE